MAQNFVGPPPSNPEQEGRAALRHPSVSSLLSFFEYRHLPTHLQEVSMSAAALANEMAHKLNDGPELTAGLRKLLEAKDCFVRQAIIDNGGN